MTFTKTINGVDPWGMPSDGGDFVSRKTKHWERQQYHKASRREWRDEIDIALHEMETPLFTNLIKEP